VTRGAGVGCSGKQCHAIMVGPQLLSSICRSIAL